MNNISGFMQKKELRVILRFVLLFIVIAIIIWGFKNDNAITVWAFLFATVIAVLSRCQLAKKVQAQDFLFLISSHMINANNENITEKMKEALQLLCEYVKGDRAHIYFREVEDIIDKEAYYFWSDEEENTDRNILQDISIVRFPWMKKQLKDKGAALIVDVNKMPDEARRERVFLLNQQIKSVFIIPLESQETKIGFIRIDYTTNNKKIDENLTKVLMMIGNILGEVHIRICAKKKIEKMAYYDQLTNIPNRKMFSKFITQEIVNSHQNGGMFGIIFLGLDSFKIVNDTLGHHYGDKILIMIAERLARCIRKTDTVCRFGGDEFLIMLNDVTSKSDIEIVAGKILEQLEQPLYIEEQEFNITASVGISIFPIDGMDKDTLIKNADIAMYKAKTGGKNQLVFCSQEIKDEIEQSLKLTSNLYHAQENNEINIMYQPQVDIVTGEIIAVEALARWEHPELGMVPPSIFIPIAEHTSLINSIGEWVLRKACEQNKKWQKQGLKPVRMAVNVSVNQLLNSNFLKCVTRILDETGLEAKYLELEITENIAIQESENISQLLSKLRKLGVSIAIDDFGIEYSSLNRIKLLSIDRLKIDMHFIKGILTCDKDKIIVDVIIKLAKDLKLKVIAEGVETIEQLEYLIEKKCDEVQGYYFYKPQTNVDMTRILTELTNNEN